jgi:histidine ammonia-lyase
MAKSLCLQKVSIDGQTLTIDEVAQTANSKGQVEVKLSPQAKEQIKHSRDIVEELLEKRAIVYGITTGFGKFKDVYVAPEQSEEMQKKFLLSHSAGVGAPFDEATSKAIILLRANALAKGFSGIRLEVVELLLDLLNKGITPVIPQQGSVGASGDLAPLSHLALVLIGEGKAYYRGEMLSGKEALAKAGLKPVTLQAKEGLALTNGTQVMSALGCLVVKEAEHLAKIADIIGAMSLEAQLGSKAAFLSPIHEARPHAGQKASAANLLKLLADSQLMESHKNCPMVQDAYSLRCMPQVHGASRQAFTHAREILATEINSATDNPLVFSSDMVISGGNFHGQPLALIMDYVGMALAELANISERRTERLVNPALSNGLPAFLILDGGLNSGFMIAQYTAAALVSENKILAHPACVDSIPTSANQEDHVSMGTIGARKAKTILENVKRVLAIELLCAAQGLDLRTGTVASLPHAGHKNEEAIKQALKQRQAEKKVESEPSAGSQAVEQFLLLKLATSTDSPSASPAPPPAITPETTSLVAQDTDYTASTSCPSDFFRPLKPGIGVEAAYNFVRKSIPHLDQDRAMSEEIEAALKIIESREFVAIVEQAAGTLS